MTTLFVKNADILATMVGTQVSDSKPYQEIKNGAIVVEDNQINRQVAVAFLTKLGCSVDIATNGSAAVGMWREGRYDMVFMDCQMPELDGFAATQAIRAMEDGGERTPIIAMTANAMAGDREACLAAGMDDYLPKPLEIQSMAEAIQRWLRGATMEVANS